MGIDPISMVIGGSALLGGVGSIVGANKQSKAAGQAAAAQTDAANRQLDLSREIYYDQRGLQQPYYQAGLQAMYGGPGLMNLLGHTQPQTTQPAASPSSNVVNIGGGAYQPGGTQQPMVQAAPGNAFAQYASGTYGQAPIGQPAPTSGPDYAGYVDKYGDLKAAFQGLRPQDMKYIANSGYDANGDGRIDQGEYGKFHYSLMGSGRELPQYQPPQTPAPGNAFAPPAQTTPANDTGPAEGSMTATLRQTPGYAFMVDEQKRGLENSFASRGKLLSGSAMKALQERSMGLADQTYGSAVDRAFQLTNIGQGGAAEITNAGNNYGYMAGNAFANMGNAAANGAMGKANAWNAGAQGLYGAAMGGLGAYGAYSGWGGAPTTGAANSGTLNMGNMRYSGVF